MLGVSRKQHHVHEVLIILIAMFSSQYIFIVFFTCCDVQVHFCSCLIHRNVNVTTEAKMARVKAQKNHLMRLQEARVYMNECIEKNREHQTTTQISFDFAQQVQDVPIS